MSLEADAGPGLHADPGVTLGYARACRGVSIANDRCPGSPASAEVMSGPFIGPGAHIGVPVTLLPFVRIGAGALVGAGATVPCDLPDGAVAQMGAL